MDIEFLVKIGLIVLFAVLVIAGFYFSGEGGLFEKMTELVQSIKNIFR